MDDELVQMGLFRSEGDGFDEADTDGEGFEEREVGRCLRECRERCMGELEGSEGGKRKVGEGNVVEASVVVGVELDQSGEVQIQLEVIGAIH